MPKLENKKPVLFEQRVFAKNYKIARLAAGLRQMDIHEKTQLAQPYLSNVERLISNVGIDTMALMSQAVKVPLYQLLQPDYAKHAHLDRDALWVDYAQQIDNSDGIPYERKVLSQNFKQARKALNLTQKEAAELSDIHPNLFIALERAEINISLTTASKLAQALGQPLHELLKPSN